MTALPEPCVGKIACVEHCSFEDKVASIPPGVRARFHVVPDLAKDGTANLAIARAVPGARRVQLIWKAKVGTKDVDAVLPLFCPVVRKFGQGVYAGESHRRLRMT
jgi:hypothetical protein